MEANVLEAIVNIANFKTNSLKAYATKSKIRANALGDQLEFFMKDAFAGSFGYSPEDRDKAYSKVFSYLGNQNNPPDFMVLGGDAVEVKKKESVSLGGSLALNSSYPKSKLLKTNPRITSACKAAEQWDEKDMIYAVGYLKDSKLRALVLVYGDCYAASPEVYEKAERAVATGLEQANLEFSKTKELGRVNRVDPLGITDMRIRGMWNIANPLGVFGSNALQFDPRNMPEFSLFAIMRKEKFGSFPNKSTGKVHNHKLIKVDSITIKNPDNPAKMIDAKLVSAKW